MAYVRTGAKYPDKYIFQADTDADVANLPTDCGIGSECVVVDSGNIYLLQSDRTWQLLGGGA